MSDGKLAVHAMEVHHRLLAYYGEPQQKPQRPPLDELVLTILSQNTNDSNSGRAWETLRSRFSNWKAVCEADVEEVAEAIRVGGLANIKAPRIQGILDHLREERGELDMAFLHDMSVDEAREYLLDLPGVGQKTAACVLLFSLHKPAMPVDTHVHRVSLRLGLVPAKTSAEKAHQALEALLPADAYYPFHLNMIRHGRTLCTARNPQCDVCPLSDICAYAQRRSAEPVDGESE
jgi:endonuclease III